MNTNDPRFELIRTCRDGKASPQELAQLESYLRKDPSFRQAYVRYINLDVALNAVAEAEPMSEATPNPLRPRRHVWLNWRPLTAAAAGLVFGLFSASIVWAISAPRVSTERLFSLQNGGFDEMRLERGFPRQIGLWSGDETAITNDGRLSFVAPGGDSNDPSARAISCDVFQLVDLRPSRHLLQQDGNAVLELSASFLDARPFSTNPSVTFFCQLFLFQGDPAALHQTWPQSIAETLASGSAQVTTLGSRNMIWKSLTAKCLVPAEADFAVIQIAARPNLRPAKLRDLHVDEVQLTLKTSPELPIRFVQR